MFGDAMRSLTLLLPAVAAGCGFSLVLLALAQVGLLPLLDPWVPSGADGLFRSAYAVALLMGWAALALTVIPGELSSWSLQRTVLGAVREGAARTLVPHPQQSRLMFVGYLTCAGGVVSLLGLVVMAIVLLVRLFSGTFDQTTMVLTAVTVAWTAVLVLAGVGFERRRAKRSPPGLVPGKKAMRPQQIVDAYWSKAFVGSVRAKAAQAAGYEQYGDARRMIRGQERRRGSTTPASAAPPATFGSRAPEWARRDRPRQIVWLFRARAILAALALATLGGRRYSRDGIEPAVALFELVVLVLLLIVHLLLVVARRRERAHVVRASRDAAAPRPSEGALTRHNAARTLESAWAGAMLVGAITPFMLVLQRNLEAFPPDAPDIAGTMLWGCLVMFVLCVLAQTLDLHVGRRARNRLMARWPSLWHSKELPG